jgi:hypothetical protein
VSFLSRHRVSLLASAVLSLSGCLCHSVSSRDLPTTRLKVRAEVQVGDQGGALLKAWFSDANSANAYVSVDAPDEVLLSAGATPLLVNHFNLAGVSWYEATADSFLSDAVFTWSLSRAGQAGGTVSLALPPTFEVTSPSQGQHVSRSAGPVTVKWSPSGTTDEMSVNPSASCLSSDALLPGPVTGDSGQQTLRTVAGDSTQSCQVDVFLTRTRHGTVGTGFAAGSQVEARQVRELTFTSDP